MNTHSPNPTATSTPRAEAPKPLPHAVPASVMRLARMRGEVEPLSPQFPGYVRYRGHWWINDDTEWVRLTEPGACAMLDRIKTNSTTRFELLKQGKAPTRR
jgi:hypothetical protein